MAINNAKTQLASDKKARKKAEGKLTKFESSKKKADTKLEKFKADNERLKGELAGLKGELNVSAAKDVGRSNGTQGQGRAKEDPLLDLDITK
mmetsp:Transcript_8319/g.14507  ORF Transcript_8319/g.14507 Transcript_8319/m.14507 type:complete len:92 (+) Transcript_8319:296-571(+)